jgi:hypothetical protein
LEQRIIKDIVLLLFFWQPCQRWVYYWLLLMGKASGNWNILAIWLNAHVIETKN